MVHSFVNHPLIPSLLFASFLCLVFSLCSARTVQIGEICSKHKKPDVCSTILHSVPGAGAGVDIARASLYIINIARADALDTKTQISKLVQNARDHQTKQRYNSCFKDYINVVLSLIQAKHSYSSGNYADLKSKGAIVIKDAQHCDTKATDSTFILLRDQDLADDSMIIMILADYLAGKY